MKLIFVRSKGHSRSFELSRKNSAILFMSVLAACVCSLAFMFSVIKNAGAVNQDVFVEWQTNIDGQIEVLRGLGAWKRLGGGAWGVMPLRPSLESSKILSNNYF